MHGRYRNPLARKAACHEREDVSDCRDGSFRSPGGLLSSGDLVRRGELLVVIVLGVRSAPCAQRRLIEACVQRRRPGRACDRRCARLVACWAVSSVSDYNRRIIDEFRATGGKVPSWGGVSPLLLLHHRGAKSGMERVNPVVYLHDDGRYVIFASKGGAPTNPGWYYNLRAHPQATIEVGGDTVAVTAREATGEERERLFSAQAERSRPFADYQAKTKRVIPVVILTPTQ
jgi:deazaflavin-dependent oxidoreductase (nitroreductase family)